MVNRLSPDEAMFYFLDGSGTSAHLGALLILDPHKKTKHPGAEVDYNALVSLVENRLQTAPRYRQIVAEITFGLARPVWVDDREFDINFHVRLSALPQPGTVEQLQELIARVMSRPLDRTRPLWEMYLIEGLYDNRSVILTKTHRCMLGSPEHPELSEVLCDDVADREPLEDDLWMPRRPPRSASLTAGALAEALARPGEVVDSLLRGNGPVADLWSVADKSARVVSGVVSQMVNAAPDSPLNAVTTSSRLFAFSSLARRDLEAVVAKYECTLNDVVLAILTGALRRWLMSVKDSVSHGETVRATMPLSARDPDTVEGEASGAWIVIGGTEFVTDLPVGEDAPSVRLMQVAGLADRYSQSTRRMSQGLRPILPELGLVPFSDRSTRAFAGIFQRAYNIPISMSSERIGRKYVGGIPITGIFTIPTLATQRALGISVNEYANQVQIAFIADRSVVGDLPAMPGYVTESLDELLTGPAPAGSDR
ncbi:wax ester/triacylglycerol synthase domain-containing protein [Gordonia hydrophobica]|uniref:diacylglycerol O-acyltransferase n=1 Tax=Gordonia hydrophobica TaxID=40516 RepID=A0ABZ2TWW2_9ACTN|nr:wax ester/triacylglycerol synthase domain-containing protein [Gordonia hydrophobica]MBM7366180.1 WS/DGAT/MGAT family acyltransferase [Gordonia hydrophobica]